MRGACGVSGVTQDGGCVATRLEPPLRQWPLPGVRPVVTTNVTGLVFELVNCDLAEIIVVEYWLVVPFRRGRYSPTQLVTNLVTFQTSTSPIPLQTSTSCTVPGRPRLPLICRKSGANTIIKSLGRPGKNPGTQGFDALPTSQLSRICMTLGYSLLQHTPAGPSGVRRARPMARSRSAR